MMNRTKTTVVLENNQFIGVDEARLIRIAYETAASHEAAGEISLTLVEAARIAELNYQFMSETGPTDVLAFPVDGLQRLSGPAGSASDSPPVLIGEVVICPEVAAAQTSSTLDSELDLLVAHGVLHLLGYDHDSKVNAGKMAGMEKKLTGRAGAVAPD